MAEVWLSPLSSECQPQSKVGLWLRLVGALGGDCSLGCLPGHGWGCKESNWRPCTLLATLSYLYIQSLCF